MKPETQELITRMEQLISNPNVRHNPSYSSRSEWVKAQTEKIKEIKLKESK